VLDATINPTGNGVNRGYLESIIFTSDPADTTSEYFFIYIDDLEFEAPVEDPTPPPSVQSPIERNDTTVTVTNISTNATVIELKKNGVVDLTTNGGGFTSFVFTLPAPAVAGDVYTANQTVDGKQSVDSLPVTVTFPGPVIGLLPKDGDTTVRISNLNPQADEVELFVGGVSRGTTATTNGIFTIDVAAGAALVMGEEVTATQIISGAASDLSPIAIVTTNSITQVFCDDFEYADQAAFDAVWEAHTGATNDTQLVLSSFLNATVGGSKSAYSDTSGSGNAANQSQLRAGSQFGPVAGTDTHPLIFNVSYHDGLAQESLYRQQAEIRARAGRFPDHRDGEYQRDHREFPPGASSSGRTVGRQFLVQSRRFRPATADQRLARADGGGQVEQRGLLRRRNAGGLVGSHHRGD
jgi:hypothetical protein